MKGTQRNNPKGGCCGSGIGDTQGSLTNAANASDARFIFSLRLHNQFLFVFRFDIVFCLILLSRKAYCWICGAFEFFAPLSSPRSHSHVGCINQNQYSGCLKSPLRNLLPAWLQYPTQRVGRVFFWDKAIFPTQASLI